MAYVKLGVLVVVVSATMIAGCTPMQIKPLPLVKEGDKSTIVIYRENSLNAGAIKMIFGSDKNDYFFLYNKDYASLQVPSGEHEIFVRSDQADNPYKLKALLANNEVKCFKAYANPANYAKALLGGIAYMTGNTFLMNEIACFNEEQLKEYSKVGYSGT